ncbi:MAG: hypothetical protein JSS02_20080 [Planctomycetes bacterium]|nr:hypothetical protein [Planctomycetota bacterium]
MSEYQYVHFQAVDRPLTDDELRFANRQSSRAEPTRWELSIEYEYSSFRGDVDGLLRRGYDVFMQFTSYGNRQIKMHLPAGLPFATKVWSPYVNGEKCHWTKDPAGEGGILTLECYDDPGDFDNVDHPEQVVDAVVKIRERLMWGDLRVLYWFWLCTAMWNELEPEEIIEPPVPHGMAECPEFAHHLLEFFGQDPLILDAAGSGVPRAPAAQSADRTISDWLATLSGPQTKDLLQRLLTGDTALEKANLLAMARETQPSQSWPTLDRGLSLAELLQKTESLRVEEEDRKAKLAAAAAKKQAELAEQQRQQRMQEMRQSPKTWLQEAEKLVARKGTDSYKEAAAILFDLREAVGGTAGDKMARDLAAKLVKKYPTLSLLKSSLRKRGLLD